MSETKPKRTTKTAASTTAAAPAKAEKKPAAKSTTTVTGVKKTAAKPAASASKAKPAAKKTSAPAKNKPLLDEEFRMRLVTDTTYYISEKRCTIASAEDDWLFAELLVDSLAFAVSKK